MPLTQNQLHLLSSLNADLHNGLSSTSASSIRQADGGHMNTIPPPVDCPQWVCCLLPCIKHIPSMKSFRNVICEDAEVLRGGEWICYDAASLVRGDIIRLREGDRIPADCVLLSIGSTEVPTESNNSSSSIDAEMSVDLSPVTGNMNSKPKTIHSRDLRKEPSNNNSSSSTSNNVEDDAFEGLYYGGHILQGCGVAVVTAIGPHTLVAKLIKGNSWPPQSSSDFDSVADNTCHTDDEEVGISLLSRPNGGTVNVTAGVTA